MIIIKLKGGLGNQMFQYAVGRLLVTKGHEIKLDTSDYVSDTLRSYRVGNFNIIEKIATSEEIKSCKYPYGLVSKIFRLIDSKVFRNFHIGYESQFLSPSDNSYLDGYWQSYKYLDPIREILLKEFTPKNRSEKLIITEEQLLKLQNTVSVHIRRTDYVSDKKTAQAHVTFGKEYYIEALEVIKTKIQNPTFIIFTDDPKWVKENMNFGEQVIFISGQGLADFEELYLMSKCQNNIIANSSFSFWGAWLNQNPDKVVIAPKKWNNKYQDKYKDLLPENWLKI